VSFPEVRGQREARRGFSRALASGRIAHAYLITGPQGTGKRRLADRVAGALLCPHGGIGGEQPETVGACGTCGSCKAFAGGNHGALSHLEAVGSGKIDIEGIRDLVASLSLRGGGYRVVIVDPAEKMGEAAANALLKTLEEPGSGVVFLLVSHRPAHLLSTIVSRCQRVSCTPLDVEDFAGVLSEHGISGDEITSLHHATGGSPGVALGLAEAIEACGGIESFHAVLDQPPSDPRALAELSPAVSGEAVRDRVLRVSRLLMAGIWARRGESPEERRRAAERSAWIGEISATLERGQSPELALELIARVLKAADPGQLKDELPAALGR